MMADNADQLRKAIADLRELLGRTDAPPSRQELLALAGILEDALARMEADEKHAVRHYSELERRLLDVENSRFLRTLQWPARFLSDWKGRLGHLLLRSPFHPLYLKLVRPHYAEDRYRAWVESEPTPVVGKLSGEPLLSVVLPVYSPRRDWLQQAVASVLKQSYGCWQLCVCDDRSCQDWITDYFVGLSSSEPRIRFNAVPRASRHLGHSESRRGIGQW
jgi:hypothetical protein